MRTTKTKYWQMEQSTRRISRGFYKYTFLLSSYRLTNATNTILKENSTAALYLVCCFLVRRYRAYHLTCISLGTLCFPCSAIRTNVGLSQTMNDNQGHDLKQGLHLCPKQVSTGLALLYVCYVHFDLPSNLIMTRLSPHVWMSRIVIGVGIIGP